MTKEESRQELETKLIQIQKWLFMNKDQFTKHEMSIVFTFSKEEKDGRAMSAFTGGRVKDIAASSVGIINELMDGVEDEEDLQKLFNMTAGRICKKFEQKMREEGYLDDEDD